jgi:anti-sigma regulatory factor (Ser/Thr protein kinase)
MDMTVVIRELDCEVGAPARARRWTAESLHRQLGTGPVTAELIDDALLCVSELVTNAVHAGCSKLRLELDLGESRLRVTVVDDAPGLPTLRTAGPGDRSGRGLRLVDALAGSWGVAPDGRSKAVWAELPHPALPSGRDQ